MALYHSTKGPVNYELVGSPTIVDGVMTYSTSSNYVKTTNVPLSTASSFEINLSIKTDNEYAVFRGLLGNNSTCRIFKIGGSGTFGIQVGGVTTQTGYGTNVSYEINIKYDNGQYVISKNGEQINSYQGTASSTDYPFAIGAVLISDTGNTDGSANYNQIDLKETYIKVNGQPWFGVCPIEVKKHQLMGPVGYTKIGNIAVTDGVATGFLQSNPVSCIEIGELDLDQPFEMQFEFTPNNLSGNSYRTVVSRKNSRGTMAGGFSVGSQGNNGFFVRIWNNSGTVVFDQKTNVTENFQIGQTYTLKVVRQTGSLYVEFRNSQNTVIGSYTYSEAVTMGHNQLTLGVMKGSGNDDAYYGTIGQSSLINLNKSWIKVNGKLWFYQPAPTKYIVKDDKLVFADSGLYLSGPNTYTVVGNPTITDGIASGFSKDNYLLLSAAFPSFNTFEMVFCLNMSQADSNNGFFGTSNSQDKQGISLTLNSSNKLVTYLSSNGTSWDISNGGAGTTVFNANSTFYVKCEFTGSQYIISSSTDKTNWTTEYTVSSSAKIFIPVKPFSIGYNKYTSNSTQFFRGFIDLKETYIKIDNSLWFYGKNYASKNIAPVPAGYTYGNTTTPSIGYVDMRTQAFTAAPSGATIGRDE